MQKNNLYAPIKLVEHLRDGLVEEEHLGFVVFSESETDKTCGNGLGADGGLGAGGGLGADGGYPFFLRSCAKPLQASLLIDYGMDNEFSMSSAEIAICTASHAGEEIHENVARELINKVGLSELDLKCGLHKPISKSAKEKLLLSKKDENIFQNNCVGKHIMMLALCRINGWDIKTYDEFNHPLQIVIKEKINSLCEVKSDYPMTKDGCGVPILSMPLKNMARGYKNLFSDTKYKKLLNAFLENPYLIGGEDRSDTKIIAQCGLVAKVGAGGILIVYNPKLSRSFVVKIMDCDMKAREIVAFELINRLGWGKIEYDNRIMTLHNEVVGQIHCAF